jgi:1,4-alpha-glucan branching enzyme
VPGIPSLSLVKPPPNDEPPVEKKQPRWSEPEIRFFEEINENIIPFLKMFERLERAKIPFKMAFVLSPILCSTLQNESVVKRYLGYLDAQIEFGENEARRSADSKPLSELVQYYHQHWLETKAYIEKYNGDLLEPFRHFNRAGNLELLASPATDCFLPFYLSYPEVINAQLASALKIEKKLLYEESAGLWLPMMGYHPELNTAILEHHFNYTIVDTHGLLLASPPSPHGSFYPVKTQEGLVVFARDFVLSGALSSMNGERYRDNSRDAGYELSHDAVEPFCGNENKRNPTGYKYWFRGGGGGNCLCGAYYDAALARKDAENEADAFLERCSARLDEASALMDAEKTPFAIAAADIDTFGRNWSEGVFFLERVFERIAAQDAAAKNTIYLTTPYEFLKPIRGTKLAAAAPLYSSSGPLGYAQIALDESNDWIYRHIFQAAERMRELAGRFDDSGIRERMLIQAAREALLSQSSLLAAELSDESRAAGARRQIEEYLNTFTAIYESLGSNFMSARWLTILEERDFFLPDLNYRIFRRHSST